MIAALKRKPSLPISLTGGGNKQSSDDQSTTTSLSSKLKSSLALFGSHLNVQDNNTRRFANDEAFERYHYRKQSLSNMTLDLKREPRGRRPSEGNSNNAATKGILVNNSTSHKRPGHHRHTHSLYQQPTQNAPSPGRKTHRRSKTAITMRPSIGVHSSGELTAKEFADMAGIKILPNDELLLVPTTTCTTPLLSSSLVSTTSSSNIDTSSNSRVLNDELVLVDKRGGGASSATTSSGSSQLPQQQSSHCSCCNCSSAISVSSMDEPVTPTTLSAATPQQQQQDTTITTLDYHKKTTTTADTKSDHDKQQQQQQQQQPHIWEDAFWRDPRKDHHEPPPIVHEMRTHNTIVIKRGRFEIHLEPSTTTTHVP
ncbi:hypothetical protein O0I10_007348 [Lichtheimia ornata]|uniref:Uncharacterized protein n=1 Tax=Lichtheimia ornata TaxID=688661 RepID=A0AAD7V1F6_9FUNG|nr:uncharacterized protein O0I10_007348 [Lichtheimia ornata]KAJ8657014.1 hypothetical protein O0I10_007348 [Lichtheimia ornata]